jgi:hypothetical protein
VKEDIQDPPVKKLWWRRIRSTNVIGVAVVACTVIALIGLAVTINDQRRVTECQKTFNDQVRSVQGERADAAGKDRAAQKLLTQASIGAFDTLLNPSSTPEDRRKSIQDWRNALVAYDKLLTDADRIRNQNPLPADAIC